jgi:hypothetical protein
MGGRRRRPTPARDDPNHAAWHGITIHLSLTYHGPNRCQWAAIGGYARARGLVSTHSPCSGCSSSPAGTSPHSPAAGSGLSNYSAPQSAQPPLRQPESRAQHHRDRARQQHRRDGRQGPTIDPPGRTIDPPGRTKNPGHNVCDCDRYLAAVKDSWRHSQRRPRARRG